MAEAQIPKTAVIQINRHGRREPVGFIRHPPAEPVVKCFLILMFILSLCGQVVQDLHAFPCGNSCIGGAVFRQGGQD
jgi:hypothetical protein